MVYELVKRLIDIIAGVAGILIFGLPMAFITIAIKLDSDGPALFTQVRVGRGGKLFPMYKFRSMVKDAEMVLERWKLENPKLWEKYKANNFKLKDDPRITSVGKMIRRYSLDELPQFLNVLKGEMSLVGPRAYKPDELENHQHAYPQAKDDIEMILTVKPGITGPWQISGRSETSFGERIKIDVGYAQRKSLLEDLSILFTTPMAVVRGKGAY